MLYMVIETYRDGPKPVYERAAAKGRMLPAGLNYVDSWVRAESLDACYQLMSTDDPALFDMWIECWQDIVDFEVIAVVTSTEAGGSF